MAKNNTNYVVLARSKNHNYLELQDRDGNVIQPIYDMVLYMLALEGKKFTRDNYWNSYLNDPREDDDPPPEASEIMDEIMEQFKEALPYLIDESRVM